MAGDRTQQPLLFYVVTLHASKKNSSLLDYTGHLRVDARRSIDYDIVPSYVWSDKRSEYDIEIPVSGIYNVFISFLCNGYTSKNVNVHGVEKVFDVVQTLFVCKAWSADQFNRMYEIKWNGGAIDPMMNFEYFGDPAMQIVLTVERKISVDDEKLQVMETCTIEEHEVCSVTSQRLHPQIRAAEMLLNDANVHLAEHMEFYQGIYTLRDEKMDAISTIVGTIRKAGADRASSMAVLKNTQNMECVGIQNIGNTCYMNSSIQCLNGCSHFSNFFYCFSDAFDVSDHTAPFVELVDSVNFGTNKGLICAWANVVVQCRKFKPFAPKVLKQEIAKRNHEFNNSKEQDAAEFIEILLTHLHEGLCYKMKSDLNNNVENGAGLPETTPELPEAPAPVPMDCSDAITAEYEKLIRAERSIVSELFYGMTTTTMECSSCGFKKFKNDLMMFLPLSIPNKVSYHSSCTLMLNGPRSPVKVLVQLKFSIQEAIEYVKVELNIASNLIALEYNQGKLLELLPSFRNINSVKNSIFLYEIKPHQQYIICHLYYRKLYFIRYKIPIDFIIEEDHFKIELYEKLRHLFTRGFTINEFLSKITIKRGQFNKILNIPSVEVVFNNVTELFGDKLSHLTVPPHGKNNDVSLRDCLEFCSRNDNVQLFCECCKVSREFYLQSSITRQPKYLIIHLKRFSYHGNGAKINTFIEFPEDSMAIGSSRYRLISTSNHIEIGLGYGHYVAYLRKGNDWYCCNDSVITKVPGPDKGSSYILFYEKIS